MHIIKQYYSAKTDKEKRKLDNEKKAEPNM